MEILITAPKEINCRMQRWAAEYSIPVSGETRFIRIASRSEIEVVVSKFSEATVLGLETNYYICSPNFGVAIPGIPSLLEDHWITEQLHLHGMPASDAVTVAQVLRHMGDF